MKNTYLIVIGVFFISVSSFGFTKDPQPGKDPNLKRDSKNSKTEAVSGVSNYTGSVNDVTGRKYQENLPKREKEKPYKSPIK